MRASRVARGFDRLSPFYDGLARLYPGDWIRRSQRVHLPQLQGARRVLIVGGGTGDFLDSLLQTGFGGEVVCLDISEAMLQRTRKRLSGSQAKQVSFRCQDVRQLSLQDSEERFDLICTHYVLDVFTDAALGNVMDRLDQALGPGGRWLCTDFSAPNAMGWCRIPQAALVRGLYTFFGAVCGIEPRRLPAIAEAFASRGYAIVGERRELAWGTLWTALFRKPEIAGQSIRSRVAAESVGQPHSAIATSNS